MKKLILVCLMLFVAAIFFGGCKKESETLKVVSVNEYYPMRVGSSFLYRLDSSVTTFGTQFTTKSYHALDSVESSFTDNTGRLSYRIFRYLRDTADAGNWVFSNTFFATPTNDQVEYVENNFRFIKLHGPVTNDFSWPGNSYIQTSTANTYLDGWNYTYQNVNAAFNVKGVTYDSTITILQKDEITPEGAEDPSLPYQQKDYSVEVYAKGIGLVYKDFLHWVRQNGVYDDGAYGVRLSLIQHK